MMAASIFDLLEFLAPHTGQASQLLFDASAGSTQITQIAQIICVIWGWL